MRLLLEIMVVVGGVSLGIAMGKEHERKEWGYRCIAPYDDAVLVSTLPITGGVLCQWAVAPKKSKWKSTKGVRSGSVHN